MLDGHSQKDRTVVFKTGYRLLKFKCIGAFCNTFDLHYKLPFVIKIFVLSIFECPLKTGLLYAEVSYFIHLPLHIA